MANNKLSKLHQAYSKENNDKIKYVQDLLEDQKHFINESLEENTTIMICGSIAMGKGVLKQLEVILSELNNKPLSYFIENDLIKLDTY